MPQVTGKFIKMFPIMEGEKDGREWIRTQFSIMTTESQPKLLGFDVFGKEKVEVVKILKPAQTVMVEYYPESREYCDRMYSNLNCHRVYIATQAQAEEGEI